MKRKSEIKNLFYGSILGGSLIAIWLGMVVSYFERKGWYGDTAEVIALIVFILIFLASVILIQKYYRNPIKSWLFVTMLILSCLALLVSPAFLTREIWHFFFLPVGVLIVGLISMIIYFIRRRFRKEADLEEEASGSSSPLGIMMASVSIVFVLPVVLSAYMRFFMPPLIEVTYPRIVVYDYLWKGKENSIKGLFLVSEPDRKGDYGDYHWITTAYLVSREWYDNLDEPWKKGEYVRKSRFYSANVISFERNAKRDFECHRCGDEHLSFSYKTEQFSEGLFLPYDVIQKGVQQGDFENYTPEPLEDILSSSDRVQFAVEFITVVSNSKEKRAVEGVYGKERRIIIPLDRQATPYAGPLSGDERYHNSQWLSMISRDETEVPEQPESIVPQESEIESIETEIPDDLGEL